MHQTPTLVLLKHQPETHILDLTLDRSAPQQLTHIQVLLRQALDPTLVLLRPAHLPFKLEIHMDHQELQLLPLQLLTLTVPPEHLLLHLQEIPMELQEPLL